MRFSPILILLCLFILPSLTNAFDPALANNVTMLQKQVADLQNELVELKSYIKTAPDGTLAFLVEKDKQEIIAGDSQFTIGGDLLLEVGRSSQVKIAQGLNLAVGGDTLTVYAKSHSSKVEKNQSLSVGQNLSQQVRGSSVYNAEKDMHFTGGKIILLTAGDKLTLQAGKASIVLAKNGDITLNGKVIEINASTEVEVKSTKDVVFKGTKVKSN